MKHPRPDFLKGVLTQEKYNAWLTKKAAAHVRRDREYANHKHAVHVTGSIYRDEIHKAVLESRGVDFFTGEPLDWHLISTFDNQKAKNGKRKYFITLQNLPTVDHFESRTDYPIFKICSYRTNGAKGIMSIKEFISFCKKVARHRRS